jgi:putative peptide zinc metalloprotease protein
MNAIHSQSYFVIPLSIQKDDDIYLIGNADIGDFYQFPELGLRILEMLRSGAPVSAIKARLAADSTELFDIDGFVEQLKDIGFVYPYEEKERFIEAINATGTDGQRIFDVDPRLAKAIFSLPTLLIYLIIVGYAALGMLVNPELRLNWSAFYTDTNRTLLLLSVFLLSLVNVVMHECGHMLAIARHGLKSKYGLSNRLWVIVAESDLTGTMALPKSQRYLPLFAGMLVDIFNIAILTLSIKFLFQYDAAPFAIQVAQALVLQIVISIAWQFNIFVKTDIYYVLSNYFSYPDLDRDARIYLSGLLYRVSFSRFGRHAAPTEDKNRWVLVTFSVIWLFGRLFSLLILFGVFLPTIWKYIASAIHAFHGPPASIWVAYDTLIFALITLTMSGIGMYMWFKNR